MKDDVQNTDDLELIDLGAVSEETKGMDIDGNELGLNTKL